MTPAVAHAEPRVEPVPEIADIDLYVDGSIIGFAPISPEARDFFTQRVQASDYQWFGGVLYVSQRMAMDLADLLLVEGFTFS